MFCYLIFEDFSRFADHVSSQVIGLTFSQYSQQKMFNFFSRIHMNFFLYFSITFIFSITFQTLPIIFRSVLNIYVRDELGLGGRNHFRCTNVVVHLYSFSSSFFIFHEMVCFTFRRAMLPHRWMVLFFKTIDLCSNTRVSTAWIQRSKKDISNIHAWSGEIW